MDAALDRLSVTVARSARLPIYRELLAAVMGEAALMPLYWIPQVIFQTAAVNGPPPPTSPARIHTYDIHLWNLSK